MKKQTDLKSNQLGNGQLYKKQDRHDFKNWLFPGEVDWKEVVWQHNTGKGYQHKQDLVACFYGAYIYIEQKFTIYFNEFEIIPNDVFNDLIFKFRKSFPKHGRIEGINYFDDLLELLINKYTPQLVEAEKPALKELNELLVFKRDNANQNIINNLFQKCKDNLNGVTFDKCSYAALYYIIFTKYKNIFKPFVKFSQFQKECDKYFTQSTLNYKPGKIKPKANELKQKYLWIEDL